DNAEDAADIVQDAFIKVYMALGRTEVQNFSAYLYRIARNLAYDEIRRRSRFADVDHEILAPEDPNIYTDPQRAVMLSEQIEMVRRAAANLNENQRAALVLKELQGFDYGQMAEVLESNRNAVGALLSRARLSLREELRMAQISTEKMPAACEEIIVLLSPYIDGELAGEQLETVDSHLSECTFCSAALEEMREASKSFRMLIPVVPPVDIAEAATAQLDTSGAFSGDMAGTQAGGQSFLSRMVRSRLLWTVAATIAAFSIGLFLFAQSTDRNGGEPARGQDTTTAAAPAFTRTQDTNTGASTTGTTGTTGTGAGQTGTTGQEAAPFGIASSSFSPNPAYEDTKVGMVVIIEGDATSVQASVVNTKTGATVSTVKLSASSSGGGQETWSGSFTAASSGSYNISIKASGAGGQQDSASAGTLTVSP
ncbi:MAG: sigma-70 family RNA polymerase sigma factor, partial [Actinomycetota bacterium]